MLSREDLIIIAVAVLGLQSLEDGGDPLSGAELRDAIQRMIEQKSPDVTNITLNEIRAAIRRHNERKAELGDEGAEQWVKALCRIYLNEPPRDAH